MDKAVGTTGLGHAILPLATLGLLVVLAAIRPTLVIEAGIIDFIIITCLIAGWAAWRFGAALAATWRPYRQVVLYALPFAMAVRWVHFALFQGALFSLHYYLVDVLVVASFASLAYFRVRAGQMSRQYHWLYRKNGLFSWLKATGEESKI